MPQQQLASPLHSLFVQHPDFYDGVNNGRMAFQDTEEASAQISTQEWVMKFVAEELDAKAFYTFQDHCKLTGTPPMSYLNCIGFVLGKMETVLTADSDFWEGAQEGSKAFDEGIFFPEDNKVWSERDVIAHMVREIDARVYRRHVCFERAIGKTPLTYLHLLGFSVGYVDRALAHHVAA